MERIANQYRNDNPHHQQAQQIKQQLLNSQYTDEKLTQGPEDETTNRTEPSPPSAPPGNSQQSEHPEAVVPETETPSQVTVFV